MSEYIQMFSNLWELAIVILIFGGSIFVHEFGHFAAAKLSLLAQEKADAARAGR